MPRFNQELFQSISVARTRLISEGEKMTVATIKEELNLAGYDSTISLYLKKLNAEDIAERNESALKLLSRD